MDTEIDWNFLSRLEGGRCLNGYVPAAGASGVTIATGIDLGTRAAPDLAALGLPEHLQAKLSPYLGKRGDAARAALAHMPLEVTEGDAALLDEAVGRRLLGRFARKYDRAIARNVPRFGALPGPVRTTIASVVWQYGPSLDRPARQGGTPRFWACITRQDWGAAEVELRAFGDAYPTRRGAEADLLRGWRKAAASPARDRA